MLIDKDVVINISSSKTIYKLFKIGIYVKIGDVIILPVEKLWKMSNIKVNVRCDICGNEKYIPFSTYNINYTKYKIYSCGNKCSSFKNKLSKLEKYGDENYNNVDKSKKTKLDRYGNENYTNLKNKIETSLHELHTHTLR